MNINYNLSGHLTSTMKNFLVLRISFLAYIDDDVQTFPVRKQREEIYNRWDQETKIMYDQLKTLALIKEKKVDTSYLINNLFIYQTDTTGLEEYNEDRPTKEQLSQEEYILIKEILTK